MGTPLRGTHSLANFGMLGSYSKDPAHTPSSGLRRHTRLEAITRTRDQQLNKTKPIYYAASPVANPDLKVNDTVLEHR